MYNPSGMAEALRQAGIWGTLPKGVEPVLETFEPVPFDYTLPVIRIAPNDSVPKNSTGPTPGASWWQNFQSNVENGYAWVTDRASLIWPNDTANPPATLPTTSTGGGNGIVLLLVAGAAVLLIMKAK